MANNKKIIGKAMQYRQLIRLIHSVPVTRPPSDSTRQIMERIDAGDRAQSYSWNRPLQRLLEEIWHWQGPTRWYELSICLFAVVFCYAILGGILYFGFQYLEGRAALPYWIEIQAPYSLFIACGLLIIGLYTLKRDRRAVRLAQSAITIHLGVATVIIIMMLRVTDEAAVLGGLLSFMSVHVILGLFMALVLHRFNSNPDLP